MNSAHQTIINFLDHHQNYILRITKSYSTWFVTLLKPGQEILTTGEGNTYDEACQAVINIALTKNETQT